MEGTALEYYNKAVAAYDRGAYEIAISEYERALEFEPDNIDILINLGAVCLQKKRVEQAIKCFEKALSIDSKNSMALYDIGKAYMFKEDYRLALLAFKEALSVNPEDIEVKQLIASCNRSLGKFKDAVAILLEIIDSISDNYEALLELAGDLKMLARYDEAMDIYRKASGIACNSVEPLKGIIDCQMHLGAKDKAMTTLKRALMLEPSNQELIIRLADLHIAENKMQEAIELIGKGLDTVENPVMLRDKYNEMVRRLPILKKKMNLNQYKAGQSSHEMEIYDILDKLYDGKMKADAALKELDVIRQQEPDDVLAAVEYANLLFQMRQYNKAAEVYSELHLAKPNKPEYRVELAKAQAMSGDVDIARETLTEGIRELGHIPELDLCFVELDLLEKNFEKAAARLDMTLKEFPDDVHGLFLYAYTAMRLDDLEQAEEAFNKLFETTMEDEEAALWYSRLALLQNQPMKALKLWNEGFHDGIDSFVEIMSRIELMICDGDTKDVMHQLCKIGEYCPRFIEDHLMFGKAYFFANDMASAQKEFDIVLKVEPQNSEALAMTALTALMRNKKAQFSNYWQKAINADSLYAVVPMMVIKDCLDYALKEKLISETKKLLNIMKLNPIDASRLKRLLQFL